MWYAVAVLTCARSSRIAARRSASADPQVRTVIPLAPLPSRGCRLLPHRADCSALAVKRRTARLTGRGVLRSTGIARPGPRRKGGGMAQPAKRPLKVGLALPDSESYFDGGTARWSDLSAIARRAEEAGFDSVWVQDHLLFRFPGQEPEGPWESFSLLAALAAVTRRVELGTLVTCASFRNPALTAKIADTMDEISGGRVILGLGAGWHEPEYRAFGYPFHHRVSRVQEAP